MTFGSGDQLPPSGGRRPPGPYGTNIGDTWLCDDSPVGRLLKEQEGTTLICEVMLRDGKATECVYHTKDPELIKAAAQGHIKYVAAQAMNN